MNDQRLLLPPTNMFKLYQPGEALAISALAREIMEENRVKFRTAWEIESERLKNKE